MTLTAAGSLDLALKDFGLGLSPSKAIGRLLAHVERRYDAELAVAAAVLRLRSLYAGCFFHHRFSMTQHLKQN